MKYSNIKSSYKMTALITVIVFIFIVIFKTFIQQNKIGFQNYTSSNIHVWSLDLIKRFNDYQSTVNENNYLFNLEQLQKQATPEEAEEYLATGVWYWPDDLKRLYIEKVWSNTIIKIDPYYALNSARTIYNQNAARELLAWNTKEGEFLLYGVNTNTHDKINPLQTKHNVIKCSNSLDNSRMEKKIYNNTTHWTTGIIKPEDIPKEVKGFSFVKGPCNPCAALNVNGDFSCPFRITTKEKQKFNTTSFNTTKQKVILDDSISEPWKQLWKL